MESEYSVYRYDKLDSPAVTAGSHAILIGTQDGLFPEMGSALPGEMGGLWAGEKKLCDGFFIAIDDVPLRCCDAFEADPASCSFHYRMQEQGLHVVRRQFVPDGVPGCVVELTCENLTGAPRAVEVSFTVRTEILTVAAARGEDDLELGRDVGEYDERAQAFFARESRNPWHVVWGADADSRALAADLPGEVYGFGNTRGKGVNGRLFYRLRVGAHAQAGMRLFIAGGYAARSQAEDALAALRERAGTLYREKAERVGALMARGRAELPDKRLARCFNWAKVYAEWLTSAVGAAGRLGRALCCDLTENPMLFGPGWAQAVAGLLPIGMSDLAGDVLLTAARLCEREQLPPGRVPLLASPDGRVLDVGTLRESAQFVAAVCETLRYGGDRALAERLLPQTGLCMSALRRATRGFESVPPELLADVCAAVTAQAFILRATGADASEWEAIASRLPEPPEGEPGASLAQTAAWHGRCAHVERLIGCLRRMADAGLPGLPGALRGENDAPDVMLTPLAIAGFVWPLARDLFGLRPDALEKTIDFAPHTPIGWAGWKLTRLPIGGAGFDVTSERVSPSRARYTIRASEPGWRVTLRADGEERTLPIDGELAVELED